DVCPVGALSRDKKTGAVVVDYGLCTGCESCVSVCPYGAITVDRAIMKAIKCDLCGGDPKCQKICPEGALQYVDGNKASYYKRLAFASLQKTELRPLIPYPRKG
ncbi:MAG: 4Fe-4S binding protein, partial [Nitrososphaerota archaeon]